MQSILEKEFFKNIEKKDIKLVSFDIFDTLAFRYVSSPKDIFYLVGQNEYVRNIFLTASLFQKYRINAEKQARQNNNEQEEITLSLIYDELNLNEEQKQKIISIEINIEEKNLFINQQVQTWMEQAYELGLKIILISDMYLSLDIIKRLVLCKLKNKEIINNVYISSEIGRTKAKGSLYQYIQNILGIKYKDWLHVGDNSRADIQNADKHGIQTLLYNTDNYVREMFELEDLYINNYTNKIQNLRVLANLNNPYEDEENRFFYNYGSTVLGPVLFEFCHWIKEVYDKYQLTQVNFIMREGKTFESYFKKLFPDVKTNLIFASRKSTFLATQNSDDFSIEKFNFHIYRDLTIEDFYALYEVSIENEIIEQYKSVKYKNMNRVFIGTQTLLDIFLEDIRIKTQDIQQNITNQKLYFKEYLKSLDIQQKSLVIDFGGTGTLLSRLDDVLDKKIEKKALFYMHEEGVKKQVSNQTLTFLSNKSETKHALEIIRRSPEFLEFLLNGMEQTTITYEKKSDKVNPIIQYPYEEITQLLDIFEALNVGIKEYFSVVKSSHIYNSQSKEFLTLMLSRSIDVPLKDEVKYFGKLIHDEGAGSETLTQLISDKQIDMVQKVGLDKVFRSFQKNLRFRRNDLLWIQGIITSIDNDYLKEMKGLRTIDVNQKAIDYFLSILDENPDINKINIYGAGEFLDKFKFYLEERNIAINNIIDRKANFEKFYYDNKLVKTLEDSITIDNSYPLLITSVAFSEEITKEVVSYCKKNSISLVIINALNGIFEF